VNSVRSKIDLAQMTCFIMEESSPLIYVCTMFNSELTELTELAETLYPNKTHDLSFEETEPVSF
jgi:hypothetical protein